MEPPSSERGPRALEQIAAQGSGRLEAISEVTTGREAHGRFLFSGTIELLEAHGFERVRQVGKHAWIHRQARRPDGALSDPTVPGDPGDVRDDDLVPFEAESPGRCGSPTWVVSSKRATLT